MDNETVIYADILVVLNYILTYLLLLCTASALRMIPSPVRLFFGSLFGGFSSLVIFLPELGGLLSFLIKALLCSIMTLIAFPCKTIRYFLKAVLIFLLVNILLAGTILAMVCLFAPGGVQVKNGTVYFDLNFLSLILTAVIGFLLISAYNLYIRKSQQNECIYDLTVYMGDESFQCRALYDSGNRLTDGYFGAPVTVVHFDALRDFIPYELLPFFSGEIFDIYASDPMWLGRIRFIPTETVGGESLLPCFRCDRVEIRTEKNVYITYRALIAVTTKGFQSEMYAAVVGPDMFSGNVKGDKNEVKAENITTEKAADIQGDLNKRAERVEKPV